MNCKSVSPGHAGNTKIIILVVVLLVAVGTYYFAVQKGYLPKNSITDIVETKMDGISSGTAHGRFPPQPEPIQAKLEASVTPTTTDPSGSSVVLPQNQNPQSVPPADSHSSPEINSPNDPQSQSVPPSPQSANEIRPSASADQSISEDEKKKQNLIKINVSDLMAPRTLGNPEAKIKVTEYSSLTCGHCADFHTKILPIIKQEYIDSGKVEFTFKEYPLNGPALVASQVLRCMPEDKFVNFMNLLFERQKNWAYVPEYKVKLMQYAKFAGVSEDVVSACLENAELKNAIATEIQEAEKKYKIKSTPTFVINGGDKIIVGDQPVSIYKDVFDEILSN